MALESESTTVAVNLNHLPASGSCGGTDDIQPKLKHSRQRLNPDKIDHQRPKPTGPLWMSPTNHGPFWDHVQNYVLLTKETEVWGWHCLYFRSYTMRLRLQKAVWSPWDHPDNTGVSTGWELAMRLKIKSRAVNLGTSLVEYRQTASLFSDAAQSLKKAFNFVRRAKRLRFEKKLARPNKSRLTTNQYRLAVKRRKRKLDDKSKLTAKDVANAQLVSSFGLKPLISDLTDSLFELKDPLAGILFQRFYVRSDKSFTFENFGTNPSEGKCKIEDRASVYVQFKPNAIIPNGHFTLGNPLELLWEVIPFSFVIDWMIPVGDYLSSLDAMNGVENMWGTVTRREDTSYWLKHDNFGYKVDNSWPSISTYKYYHRQVLGSIPLPSHPFHYEPSTSLKSVANGIALLVQLSGGGRSHK